jgi:hypothetical protein
MRILVVKLTYVQYIDYIEMILYKYATKTSQIFCCRGEWMNLRIYFPEKYQKKIYEKVGDFMDLQPECFNSVCRLHSAVVHLSSSNKRQMGVS